MVVMAQIALVVPMADIQHVLCQPCLDFLHSLPGFRHAVLFRLKYRREDFGMLPFGSLLPGKGQQVCSRYLPKKAPKSGGA